MIPASVEDAISHGRDGAETKQKGEMNVPIFEFECKDCCQTFERIMSATECEQAPPSCPQCGGTHVERLLSAFSACRPTSDGGDAFSSASSCKPKGGFG